MMMMMTMTGWMDGWMDGWPLQKKACVTATAHSYLEQKWQRCSGCAWSVASAQLRELAERIGQSAARFRAHWATTGRVWFVAAAYLR